MRTELGRRGGAARSVRATPAACLSALLLLAALLSGCGDTTTGPPAERPAPVLIARLGGDRSGAYRVVGGLDVDADGQVYVFDEGEVQLFNAAGEATRRILLTDGEGNSPYDGGLRLAPDGTLLVMRPGDGFLAYAEDGTLERHVACAECGDLTLFGETPPFDVDAVGRVYLLDVAHQRVLRFDAQGNLVGSFGSRTSEAGGFLGARDLVVDPAGIVYVSDQVMGRVTRYASDGTLLGTFDYSHDPYPGRRRLALLPDGNLLLSTPGSPNLEVWSGDGQLGGTVRLSLPAGGSGGLSLVRVGRDGRIYCLDFFGQILRFESDGSGRAQLGRLYGAGPRDLARMGPLATHAGQIFVVTEGGSRIRQIDLSGNLLDDWRSTRDSGGFQDLVVDVSGRAYTLLPGLRQVARLDPGGVVMPVATIPPPGFGLSYWNPIALAVDGRGGFLVTLAVSGEDPFIAHLGGQGAWLGGGPLRGADAEGSNAYLGPLRSGGRGELWGLASYPIRLHRFNDALEDVEQIPLDGLGSLGGGYPRDFAFDPSGDVTLITSGSAPNMLRVDRAGRLLDAWTLTGDGVGPANPGAIAYDERGRLYLTDRRTDTILVFAAPGSPAAGLR